MDLKQHLGIEKLMGLLTQKADINALNQVCQSCSYYVGCGWLISGAQ